LLRRTISVTPGLCAYPHQFPDERATYYASTPLEDTLVTGVVSLHAMRVWSQLPPDLESFLRQPSVGAKAVAKALLARLMQIRMGQLNKVMTDMVRSTPDRERIEPLFNELPGDQGHFSEPYFPHVLRGLLPVPPPYVLEAQAGEPITATMPDSIAGVVVLPTGISNPSRAEMEA